MDGDPAEGAKDSEREKRRQLNLQMAALGLEFSGSVIGGLALGYYLDEWFGTSPWCVMIGTFGGLGAAVLRLISLTKRFQRMRDDRTDP